jgi:hypothetical protein
VCEEERGPYHQLGRSGEQLRVRSYLIILGPIMRIIEVLTSLHHVDNSLAIVVRQYPQVNEFDGKNPPTYSVLAKIGNPSRMAP